MINNKSNFAIVKEEPKIVVGCAKVIRKIKRSQEGPSTVKHVMLVDLDDDVSIDSGNY